MYLKRMISAHPMALAQMKGNNFLKLLGHYTSQLA